ncbi:MAG TPA: chemotaxis protein CheW [Bryobacteraceae bacterium]|nr:chemotaxis protein CheW [Bryobacteraceae bacterium]
MRAYPADMPWAIVQTKNQAYAIATQDMREMVVMPAVARVPNVPDYIRGVINLRGRVMPLADLRRRMGLTSALEETEGFCTMMQQREQDHRNWLNELESSVKQRRPFTLATDSHKCAFGKWYDTYHADNPWVAALLKKFDAPHKQVHAVAVEVEKLKAKGEHESAEECVTRARNGVLAKLLKLFADLRDLVHETERETAVVLTHENKVYAVSVDLALSIEKFAPGSIEGVSALVPIADDGIVRRLGKRAKNNDVVLIIETDHLMSRCELDAVL